MKNIALTFPIHVRAVALVTAIALLAWAFGLPAWIQHANAANVSSFTDTLSDSDIGADATHTLTFTTSNAMNAGEQFAIYFDEATSAFDFTGVLETDLITNASGITAVNTCGAGPGTEVDLEMGAGDFIVGTVCPGHTVPAGEITIQVGAVNEITNPSPTGPQSYVISLQGYGATPIADEGDTRVAIIDDVTVTASVDTIFDFSINGVDADVSVNDDVTLTSGTSTATSVPFGTIAPGTAKLIAQELEVDTNALNGFSVSVFADQTLTAGNGATIDEFDNGVALASTTVWGGPDAILGSTDTYGHWGLTSDDNAVSSTTQPNLWGASDAWYTGDFILNPVEVFYNNTPVDSSQGGMGVGTTTVAYKVEISNLQEAAKDYTATLTYIATPVF